MLSRYSYLLLLTFTMLAFTFTLTYSTNPPHLCSLTYRNLLTHLDLCAWVELDRIKSGRVKVLALGRTSATHLLFNII